VKKLTVLFLTLLSTILYTSPAHAGPIALIGIGALVGAGAAAFGFIAASVLTAAAIGAAVGLAAALLAPALMGGMFDTPDYNVTQNAQAVNDGIQLNKTGTLESIPVVYGTRKVGGKVVYLSTGGSRNKYLYMVLVLSEGEIDSIQDIYINDVISTDPRFNNRFQFEIKTGTDNQAAANIFMTGEAPGWDSTFTLSGIAYIACRFEWKKIDNQDDADANPYSGIPRVQVVMRGKKVKSMAGLNNTHATAYENETGIGFSNNPADCLADYLRNPRYGRGLPNDRINFVSFSTARAKFAQIVTYNTGVKGLVLTCDAVIDTGRSLLDNVKLFLANCRSGIPYVQGRFKLKMQDTGHDTDSQNPTPAILPIPGTTDNKVSMKHIVGGMKIQGNGTREHFNQVKITYVDPTNEWKTNEVIYPELNSSPDLLYLAEDNGRRLTKELAFNHIISKHIASDLAHIILTQSRDKKSIAFDATAELHEAEVNDIINVDYDPLAIQANYRIKTIKINADYTISLTAQEHIPAAYVFSDTSTIQGSSNQLKYVDNIAETKYYAPNEDGTWDSVVTPPANPNEPSLPVNNSGIDPADLNINNFAVRVTRDWSLTNARQLLTVNCVVSDNIADQTRTLILESYSNLDDRWIVQGDFDPGTVAKVGGFYPFIVGVAMDGSPHQFRLRVITDNNDRFPSAISTYDAPLSKYRSSKYVSF
tara:strand:- start:1344 stop:3455 length:2112 start_codon:yes stop_codon:yes gene_type:complete